MAFEAQLEQVPRVAWLLLLANVLWVTVYDTIYAMVDRDDDIRIGVRSTAILFGDSDRHIIAVLQLMTLVSLYLVGRMIHMGDWYLAGWSDFGNPVGSKSNKEGQVYLNTQTWAALTGIAKGGKLIARGRVLQAGRTNSVGAADVYSVSAGREVLCGTVLATTRNFQIRSPS